MTRTQCYYVYLGLAVGYVLVKALFLLSGYLHPGALLHGSLPAALTIAAGALAWRRDKPAGARTPYGWVAILMPCLVFVLTPVYMRLKAGELWLDNGRMYVLLLYWCLALGQVGLAVGARIQANRGGPGRMP
jgi:hypothetical protein